MSYQRWWINFFFVSNSVHLSSDLLLYSETSTASIFSNVSDSRSSPGPPFWGLQRIIIYKRNILIWIQLVWRDTFSLLSKNGTTFALISNLVLSTSLKYHVLHLSINILAFVSHNFLFPTMLWQYVFNSLYWCKLEYNRGQRKLKFSIITNPLSLSFLIHPHPHGKIDSMFFII